MPPRYAAAAATTDNNNPMNKNNIRSHWGSEPIPGPKKLADGMFVIILELTQTIRPQYFNVTGRQTDDLPWQSGA